MSILEDIIPAGFEAKRLSEEAGTEVVVVQLGRGDGDPVVARFCNGVEVQDEGDDYPSRWAVDEES